MLWFGLELIDKRTGLSLDELVLRSAILCGSQFDDFLSECCVFFLQFGLGSLKIENSISNVSDYLKRLINERPLLIREPVLLKFCQ